MALPDITMRQLLEAGVHFGHVCRRWNPKMKKYIFGEREGVHIMDLRQTLPMMQQALEVMRDVASKGGRILFVGTKKQAAGMIAETAEKCGQYYINHRWLGGTLTNWSTLTDSIKRLNEMEDVLSNPEKMAGFTKKELLNMTRNKDKLLQVLGGIRNMAGLPNLMFVIDANKEHIAIQEANNLGIPVIAILDSNSNPEGITFPIPGNDDANKAIKLYCNLAASAILSGLKSGMQSSGVDIGAMEEVEEDLPSAKSSNKEENSEAPVAKAAASA